MNRVHEEPIALAYLGPEGTYGHMAAKSFAKKWIQETALVPCATIADVYHNDSPYLAMPLQNKIHGAVIETLDCLFGLDDRSSQNAEAGPSRLPRPRIIGSLDLPINHSLVVKKGTRMEDIEWVRSHEQALGQSSEFLKAYLPNARKEKWASTAGAALSLLIDNGENGKGAAICSASIVIDQPELEVLYEGTQSLADNHTRFILLSRIPKSEPTSPDNIVSFFYTTTDPSILSSETFTKSRIKAIHSRPSASATSNSTSSSVSYPVSYLIEVEGVPLVESTSELEYIGSVEFKGIPT